MANNIRIRRRAAGGAAGAPTSLMNAELAYNEQDDVLYYGKGTGGAGGTATQVIPIAGPGFAAPIESPTFTGTPAAPTPAVDTNSTRLATTAFVAGQAGTATPLMSGTAAVGTSLRYARQDHKHPTDTTRAPLASPAFTGTPTAPTAPAGASTTQVATTAFVTTAVSSLVAAAPAALDTLNELAAALGNDANFATTVSTSLGNKMEKASNLSDVASAAAARTNLGLGSMATQSAAAVAITGGSIDNINLDGGTF